MLKSPDDDSIENLPEQLREVIERITNWKRQTVGYLEDIKIIMMTIKRESVTVPLLGFGTPSEGNRSNDEVPLDAAGIEALAKRKEFEERREEEDKVEGSSNKGKEPDFPIIPRFGIGRGRGGGPPEGPSRNPSPGNPAQGQPMPRELKINFPKMFDGKPSNLKRFL